MSVTVASIQRFGQQIVLIHHPRQQSAIERAPVDADAHGPIVLDGRFDHGAEVVVVLLADVDVAGIDAVLGERAGAVGILPEQEVAVVVEVADDRHANAELVERFDNFGNGPGGIVGIDGDADQLGSCLRQRHYLIDGRHHVRRVGVGHRLHDDRVAAADFDTADVRRNRTSGA